MQQMYTKFCSFIMICIYLPILQIPDKLLSQILHLPSIQVNASFSSQVTLTMQNPSVMVCFKCNLEGHTSANCTTGSPGGFCAKCNRRNHLPQHCKNEYKVHYIKIDNPDAGAEHPSPEKHSYCYWCGHEDCSFGEKCGKNGNKKECKKCCKKGHTEVDCKNQYKLRLVKDGPGKNGNSVVARIKPQPALEEKKEVNVIAKQHEEEKVVPNTTYNIFGRTMRIIKKKTIYTRGKFFDAFEPPEGSRRYINSYLTPVSEQEHPAEKKGDHVIYAIKYEDEKIYVGSAKNLALRINQHKNQESGKKPKCMGNLKPVSLLAWFYELNALDEGNFALDLMDIYGYNNVRGYIWVRERIFEHMPPPIEFINRTKAPLLDKDTCYKCKLRYCHADTCKNFVEGVECSKCLHTGHLTYKCNQIQDKNSELQDYYKPDLVNSEQLAPQKQDNNHLNPLQQ
eukprot:TRINITY_DN120523_c0_g1_i1.p1 TRINITY_DN120523_c0_g1~~TRINITY_DN120523_c0_g1_i1.p1  ORF type:complete len:452 (-),score=21.39 TRINITY_DN120523_c0_g1_i1:602-1957(-)